MTVLTALCVIALFFIVPFLIGNIYYAVFHKKTMGVASIYLSGMAFMYAGLLGIQLFIIKFKFNFLTASRIYSWVCLGLIVLGGLSFVLNLLKKRISFEIAWSKNAWWIYGLIVLQGVLNIVLKNPYFENNALLEMTKVTMETGTIYEYNAFTKTVAVAGFPLSNKLMYLPVFYAYICGVFKVNPSILLNFIVPVVTFLSFYIVMCLWIRLLAKEYHVAWQKLLFALACIVQVGDGWMHSTSFHVLHEGYTGEAIFFGIIAVYLLYDLKNGRYLTALACMAAYPGLVKYDAVLDYVKNPNEFWMGENTYGAYLALFFAGVLFLLFNQKKMNWSLLNVNLTICTCAILVWERAMMQAKNKKEKIAVGVVLIFLLLLCGNMTIVSGATQWRSNRYGVPQKEYAVLNEVAKNAKDDVLQVMAYDSVNKWIRRTDFPIEPVVGYDAGMNNAKWYSYETYNEPEKELWELIHYESDQMESGLMVLKEEIPMDYIVTRCITEWIPIEGNPDIVCVIRTPEYLVYSVDKK